LDLRSLPIHLKMSFESEYKLDNVAATPVAADKIEATFRSSTIGQFYSFVAPLCLSQGGVGG
jgi:hypothetical protein